MINLDDKSSIPGHDRSGNPLTTFPRSPVGARTGHTRPPVTWFMPRPPGTLAQTIREMRPPVSPGSKSAYAIRIPYGDLVIGDRIGAWVVTDIARYRTRNHGHPCHCVWTSHADNGIRGNVRMEKCSYENPECPCKGFTYDYTVTCRCDCGTVKPVSTCSLITGYSLSCGHCRCKSLPCHHEGV